MPKKVTKKGTNAKNIPFLFSQTFDIRLKSKILAGLRCPCATLFAINGNLAKWFKMALEEMALRISLRALVKERLLAR